MEGWFRRFGADVFDALMPRWSCLPRPSPHRGPCEREYRFRMPENVLGGRGHSWGPTGAEILSGAAVLLQLVEPLRAFRLGRAATGGRRHAGPARAGQGLCRRRAIRRGHRVIAADHGGGRGPGDRGQPAALHQRARLLPDAYRCLTPRGAGALSWPGRCPGPAVVRGRRRPA